MKNIVQLIFGSHELNRANHVEFKEEGFIDKSLDVQQETRKMTLDLVSYVWKMGKLIVNKNVCCVGVRR